MLLVPSVNLPFVPTQNFSLQVCHRRCAGPFYWRSQRGEKRCADVRMGTRMLLKHYLEQGVSKAELRPAVPRRSRLRFSCGPGAVPRVAPGS